MKTQINISNEPTSQPARGAVHGRTQKMVITSLFIALTFLLGLTPWGIIPLGFVNVTILCVPVIIGTIALGLNTGLLLGACFGFASTLRAFGIPSPASSLVATLLAENAVYVIVMSMLPRLLVPVAAHYVFRLMHGILARRNTARAKYAALPVAAACASLTNTVLYLGLMLLFYIAAGLDHKAILTLIAGTGIIAGSLEALAAAIIVPGIVSALWALKKPYIRSI